MYDSKESRRLIGQPAANGSRTSQPLRSRIALTRSSEARHHATPVRRTSDVATQAIGYASGSGRGDNAAHELAEQAEVIAQECEERGLELLGVVHEREPASGKALSRPGLTYALERIATQQAGVLVVSELSRITRSAAELGAVIQWITGSDARLVAAAHALDTDRMDGRLAADLLVEVSGWEAARLSERTRNGLEAARRNGRLTGRPAVADNPDLKERILQMRAEGMTLQAIADRLNAEGVPTVRGGTKWRHSSVQAAAGYKRRRAGMPIARPRPNGNPQAH
jgi:DNA invertase Pin-like site-specific DNA recombinase